MDKTELTAREATRTLFSRSGTHPAVNARISAIADAPAGGETAMIDGFGTFSPRSRSVRRGWNSRTGENIPIAASNTPIFKAEKAFRDPVG